MSHYVAASQQESVGFLEFFMGSREAAETLDSVFAFVMRGSQVRVLQAAPAIRPLGRLRGPGGRHSYGRVVAT